MQRVEGVVEVDAPLELVFDSFSDFESFPRWMHNIRVVRRTGSRTAHWVSATALPDVYAEWDAEVTACEPDRRIAWRSVRGDIHADGEAIFSLTREGTTLVRVVLGFDTPLGRTGAQASRFFGVRLDRQLEEDLEQFRRSVEREAHERQRESERHKEREHTRDGTFAPVVSGRLERRTHGAEEYEPRYALTPRERERERGANERTFDPRVSETFKRRGVDRLMDKPPSESWTGRGRS